MAYKLDPPISTPGNLVVGDASARKRDALLLGTLAESGPRRELWLDISGEQVVAIFGKRGTGKSFTLGVILEALSAGRENRTFAQTETPRAGLVLDIMDIFWTSQIKLDGSGPPQLRQQHDVMRRRGYDSFDPMVDVWVPAGFQKPEIDPDGLRTLTVPASELNIDDWGTLFDLDVYNEPRGLLFADILIKLSRDGYRTEKGETIPPRAQWRLTDALRCLDSDVDIHAAYKDDTRRAVRQRISSYASLQMFQGEGTRLDELLQPGRVSVLMLARTPDALKQVIVATLIRRLLRERRDSSFAQKRLDLDARLTPEIQADLQARVAGSAPRSWILLDEAHVLAPAGGSTLAGDALTKYAKEGRNYGLSLCLATQQPSALDAAILSQVETLLLHQLSNPKDAAIARDNLRSPAPVEARIDGALVGVDELIRRLGQGEVLFSSANAPSLNRCCVAAVRPRVSAHGGYEA